MADIALKAKPDPITRMPVFDIDLTAIPDGATTVARDVAMDAGLDTSIYVSLFTDARANREDAPDTTDLRGWWGDEFGPIGSRLWELTRGKATDEALNFAKVATEEALQWLVDSGVATSVTAQATRIGLYAISIIVQVQKPDDQNAAFRYALNWAATG